MLEWCVPVHQGGSEKMWKIIEDFEQRSEVIWVSIQQDQFGCCFENRLRRQGQNGDEVDQFLGLL